MTKVHRREHLHIETRPMEDGQTYSLAVSLHLPLGVAINAPILVALPGSGYNRHYYDLRTQGYSEAAYHTERGIVVIAIDHYGSGDSDKPASGRASLATAASIGHEALQVILERLKSGNLVDGLAPIAPTVVVAVGQSMGGHIAVMMNAEHGDFDGIAVLGSSMVCTWLRAENPDQEVCLLGQKDHDAIRARVPGLNWKYISYWDDVPGEFTGAGAASVNGERKYYISTKSPDSAPLMLPGQMAHFTAKVRCPVLVGMGERDVCHAPLTELAEFSASGDRSVIVVERMAHMHNFAGTRAKMWARTHSFVRQVESGHVVAIPSVMTRL